MRAFATFTRRAVVAVAAAGVIALGTALPADAGTFFIDAVDDVADTQMNTPVTIDVLANDNNTYPTLSVSIVTAPVNGIVSGSGGTRQYTPDSGFVGDDTFVYAICGTFPESEFADCDAATVTIHVTVPPATTTTPPTVVTTVAPTTVAAATTTRPTVAAATVAPTTTQPTVAAATVAPTTTVAAAPLELPATGGSGLALVAGLTALGLGSAALAVARRNRRTTS